MTYKKFLFLLIFSVGFQMLSAQKPIFTKAKVNTANVYRQSAELQNSASVTIPAGNSEIVIGNISQEIDEKSLQIGINNKNVTILSSQFTDDYATDFKLDTTNPIIKKVNDSIKLVENAIVKSNIELEANNKVLELLDKNQTVLVGSNTSTVAQLTQLADYYTKKRIEISTKLVAIRKDIVDLQTKLTRLKSSLKTNEQKEAEEFASGVLVLKIMSRTAGSVRFDINYLANRVSWNPLYEVKGEKISDPLDVTLKAVINQKTGLDWKDVKLSLINGVSSRNNTAPVVQPWFLYGQSKDERDKLNGIPGSAPGINVRLKSVAEYSSNVAIDEVVVQGYSANAGFSANSNQLNVSYDVDIPYNILSNGQDHIINLFQQNIPATYEYFAAPRFSNDAFLLAKIKDFSKYGLLTAPANIIFENMYIGETTINPNQTDAELNITLGNDRRISIKKEDIKDKSSDKFLSSSREKVVTYDLIIRNNKKESINIEIKDGIPLSNNEAIKVEVLETSGAKKDDETGILLWNLKIGASETKKLRVSYKVKYPKDFILNNL
ncbi:DUF4139 domain-containing protein [Frigoriflavimonas asaccharolytica]|uniref:Uncharacterized protein (TIGR02231 family) n=1 Tax=Frigoriflavimonas asaccharolytica TaxID=2735899 RepID=A0A8J8G470_9FLAO|nr:DUF4139 domain-containing protein [Frigoriflavimonas asaccharolytica]NRS91153.1 uncharacterized protein (TIGR02231 family) [Frigoriflavimonas asaccharolytica]